MILFIADLFVEDVIGGAELTSESVIRDSSLFIKKIHSRQVSQTFINQHKEDFWIFGNFVGIPENLLIYISQNINYAVIEYDYKFCKWRSPPKHQFLEDDCKCAVETRGKLISIFYYSAKSLWFMSEGQKDIYCEYFPFLKKNSFVLNSSFTDETLDTIQNLIKDPQKKDDKWLILNSQSWIKGLADCVRYARKNNLNYELIDGLSHIDMLKKLSQSHGLIFMPKAQDTCPRIVIEAKLLGCELILNENVQHKNEEWFATSEKMVNHFKERKEFFWNKIYGHSLNREVPDKVESARKNNFKIVVPCFNAEKWIKKCLISLKSQNYNKFSCVVIDDNSSDNTYKVAQQIVGNDPRFKLVKNEKRVSPLANVYKGPFLLESNDEDIIITLDGDDWFINNNVLNYVNNFYNENNCWLTYGSFIRLSCGNVTHESEPYSLDIVKSNNFRQERWLATHLRSYKFKLLKHLDKKELLDEDGNFYKHCGDQALMLPLLELAGSKSRFISDALYVYNDLNPINEYKIEKREQDKRFLEIRNKPKLKPLVEL